jgi:hypothetical protein
MLTCSVAVDWERNGNFTDASDDLTPYVTDIQFNIGFREPYKSVAGQTEARIQLRNDDRRFSPEYGFGPLVGANWLMRPLRIQYTAGTTTVTRFTGWTTGLDVGAGNEQPFVTLIADGVEYFLRNATVYMDLLLNQRSDQALAEILGEVRLPPATANPALALGIVGHAELGQNTYLQSSGITTSLETGRETFPFMGDNWNDVKALETIKDVVEAERGRFFFSGAGDATFWNRHHLIQATTVAETITDEMQDLAYGYGQDIANRVIVTVYPRSASGTEETIWQLDEPVTINAGREREFRPRYRDIDSNARISAQGVVKPNTNDGTLAFSEGTATITAFKSHGTTATIKLQAGSKKCVVSTIIIKGKKLTDFSPIDIEVRDGVSQFDNGKQDDLKLDLRLLDNETTGRNIANYELARRKNAAGRISSIGYLVKDEATELRAMNRGMGDRLTIAEAQTGHSDDYFIIGERHNLSMRGDHRIAYTLEPAGTYLFAKLGTVGYAELGVNTYIAPF